MNTKNDSNLTSQTVIIAVIYATSQQVRQVGRRTKAVTGKFSNHRMLTTRTQRHYKRKKLVTCQEVKILTTDQIWS